MLFDGFDHAKAVCQGNVLTERVHYWIESRRSVSGICVGYSYDCLPDLKVLSHPGGPDVVLRRILDTGHVRAISAKGGRTEGVEVTRHHWVEAPDNCPTFDSVEQARTCDGVVVDPTAEGDAINSPCLAGGRLVDDCRCLTVGEVV